MVGGQRQENLVYQNNVLEVVDDSLAVQEVHGRCQPVPVEALCRSEGTGATGDIGNGNDLLEGDDLDCGDDEDDVDVAHEQRSEEASEHDERPEGARHEVGLLLLVLCIPLLLGRGFLGGQMVSESFSV